MLDYDVSLSTNIRLCLLNVSTQVTKNDDKLLVIRDNYKPYYGKIIEKEMLQMKVDVVKVVKIASMVASVAGMIGSSWANGKENKNILENLAKEHFENQK